MGRSGCGESPRRNDLSGGTTGGSGILGRVIPARHRRELSVESTQNRLHQPPATSSSGQSASKLTVAVAMLTESTIWRTTQIMTANTQALLKSARALPSAAQVELIEALIAGLDEVDPEPLDEATMAEIQRRSAEY